MQANCTSISTASETVTYPDNNYRHDNIEIKENNKVLVIPLILPSFLTWEGRGVYSFSFNVLAVRQVWQNNVFGSTMQFVAKGGPPDLIIV